MLLCWIHVVSLFNEDLNPVAAIVITVMVGDVQSSDEEVMVTVILIIMYMYSLPVLSLFL